MTEHTTKYKSCPNSPGAYSGIKLDGKTIVAGRMSCNSWNCPYCHDKLKKKLFKRIFNGALSDQSLITNRFSLKFLTLTCGGREIRENFSPLEVYEQMVKAWDRLVKFLRGRYGFFHYFRVCELHKDGYPHFHVLLAGKNVIPKELLSDIEWSWQEVSEMGFVKINTGLKKQGFNDVKHAINYMLKYISKNIQKVGKNKRIFTASRGALLKIDKLVCKSMLVYLGPLGQSTVYEKFREIDYTDQIISLPGIPYDCISTGVTIRPFDDYLESAQQAHFDRVTVGRC